MKNNIKTALMRTLGGLGAAAAVALNSDASVPYGTTLDQEFFRTNDSTRATQEIINTHTFTQEELATNGTHFANARGFTNNVFSADHQFVPTHYAQKSDTNLVFDGNHSIPDAHYPQGLGTNSVVNMKDRTVKEPFPYNKKWVYGDVYIFSHPKPKSLKGVAFNADVPLRKPQANNPQVKTSVNSIPIVPIKVDTNSPALQERNDYEGPTQTASTTSPYSHMQRFISEEPEIVIADSLFGIGLLGYFGLRKRVKEVLNYIKSSAQAFSTVARKERSHLEELASMRDAELFLGEDSNPNLAIHARLQERKAQLAVAKANGKGIENSYLDSTAVAVQETPTTSRRLSNGVNRYALRGTEPEVTAAFRGGLRDWQGVAAREKREAAGGNLNSLLQVNLVQGTDLGLGDGYFPEKETKSLVQERNSRAKIYNLKDGTDVYQLDDAAVCFDTDTNRMRYVVDNKKGRFAKVTDARALIKAVESEYKR